MLTFPSHGDRSFNLVQFAFQKLQNRKMMMNTCFPFLLEMDFLAKLVSKSALLILFVLAFGFLDLGLQKLRKR